MTTKKTSVKQQQKQELIASMIQDEFNNGNLCVITIDGIMKCNFEAFMKQPINGILYDINRSELTILADKSNHRWVNDFAAVKVIRELHRQLEIFKNK